MIPKPILKTTVTLTMTVFDACGLVKHVAFRDTKVVFALEILFHANVVAVFGFHGDRQAGQTTGETLIAQERFQMTTNVADRALRQRLLLWQSDSSQTA
jgi:hypothetical protein